MKKGVIAVLLLLVVVVIVSPAIVGKMAEDQVGENLNWAAAESGELKVTSDGFDRGWFSSEGQHRIELGDGQIRSAMLMTGDDADLPALVINTHIDHGLIPVTSMQREKGSLAPGLGSAVSTLRFESGGESFDVPGAIYSKVGLGGGLESSYLVDAGTQEMPEGTLTWEDTRIDFATNPGNRGIAFDGTVGSFIMEGDGEKVTIDGLTMKGEQSKTDYGLTIGDIDINVGKMSVEQGGTVMGSLNELRLTGDTSVSGDDVNSVAKLKVDVSNIPNVGDVSVIADMSLTDGNAKAFGQLEQRLDEMGNAADPMLVFGQAGEELQDLFASGFKFNIDQLDVTLPMGTVETVMHINIPESDRDSFVWTSLLLSAGATLDLKVPEALVTMASQMDPQVGMIIGMGYLKKNGDIYEMSAAFESGALTINGAPVPLPF